MKVHQTSISGVVVVETTPFHDARGAFSRLYCERGLGTVLGDRRIVQINHSRTHLIGAVRGLHYQLPPHAEMKLVRCLSGRVWDVAVDLRTESPTLGQWHAEQLTADNARLLVIPEGCAHGFQTLEANCELLYLHSEFYAPDAEAGVRWDDPRIGITWPLPVTDLSERDTLHPLLTRNFSGIFP